APTTTGVGPFVYRWHCAAFPPSCSFFLSKHSTIDLDDNVDTTTAAGVAISQLCGLAASVPFLATLCGAAVGLETMQFMHYLHASANAKECLKITFHVRPDARPPLFVKHSYSITHHSKYCAR